MSAPRIAWSIEAIGKSNISMLPGMLTDIVLESTQRKVIIDAKYYREALKTYYDTAKFYSPNLYQLYAYLRNIETDLSHLLNPVCEGILLYPVVEYNLPEDFLICGHKFSVKTVNLANEWQLAYIELLSIIDKYQN